MTSVYGYSFLHQVQSAMRSSSGSKASFAEGVESSVIYVRFKAAASEVKFALFLFCLKMILLK